LKHALEFFLSGLEFDDSFVSPPPPPQAWLPPLLSPQLLSEAYGASPQAGALADSAGASPHDAVGTTADSIGASPQPGAPPSLF